MLLRKELTQPVNSNSFVEVARWLCALLGLALESSVAFNVHP